MDPISHLKSDPELKLIIEEYGNISIEPADDEFQRFTVSIVNQQLSSDSAAAIRDRLFNSYEVNPESMIQADEQNLSELGLSQQKISYIKNIAEAYLNNGIGSDYFEELDDDDAIQELTKIKGVGNWTAKMYLMFCLGREDIFPVEDLGIRRGMELLYGLEDRDAMVEKAAEWAPYRSYASRYVWRAYE